MAGSSQPNTLNTRPSRPALVTAMAAPPVTVNTTINLADHGLNANSFRFGSLTMESDKYISVKDTAPDGSAQVVSFDMHNNNAVNKRPMKAEASLMNPADNIIALKGSTDGTPGHFVQVSTDGERVRHVAPASWRARVPAARRKRSRCHEQHRLAPDGGASNRCYYVYIYIYIHMLARGLQP